MECGERRRKAFHHEIFLGGRPAQSCIAPVSALVTARMGLGPAPEVGVTPKFARFADLI